MNARLYLAVARRGWATILAAMLAAGLAGFLAAQAVPPTYQAETRVLIGPANADLDILRASALIVETYAELVVSEEALTAVISQFGLAADSATLGEGVRVVANPTTRLLTIEVTHTDGSLAAQVANALAQELSNTVGPSANPANPAGTVRVIDSARQPTEPIAPDIVVLTGLAAAGGLLTALLLVVVMERFRSTVASPSELADLSGAPYLGSVHLQGGFRPTPADPLFVDAQPGSDASLSTWLLTNNLGIAPSDLPTVILVLGMEPGGEVAELTANMAGIWARRVSDVIMLDADEADEGATRLLGASGEPGLSELLSRPTTTALSPDLDAMLVRHSDTLSLLPRGRRPLGLVNHVAAAELINELRSRYKMVVISAGPVRGSASAVVWAGVAAITLLVAQLDVTTRQQLRQAVESLQVTGTTIGGVAVLERRRRLLRLPTVSGRRARRSGRVPLSKRGEDL